MRCGDEGVLHIACPRPLSTFVDDDTTHQFADLGSYHVHQPVHAFELGRDDVVNDVVIYTLPELNP